ncbi:CopG family ribbon-helix-helix protein [Nguyenibacter vanlangensis]|uniref:Ribbon-helix-helix protein, CopG family n=1 Tax=Nguyenibacter vanlangensis TaxID=1216886 RepID=A0A7Y7IUH7_9PROT|nr:ribbon-helix-helix protein, CopG family [Nguyenibacter vanlangensis]NVN10581.1 ribbon-helix-helix protein, CopG family [Nguyenibacter vanlangensis]
MSDKPSAGKQVVSVQMPADLVDAMDRYGESIERPRSWVMREAVASYLAYEAEKDRATRRALADVDAGRLVSAEAVKAWADGLDKGTPLPLPKPGQ